jgi:hypothetical protein
MKNKVTTAVLALLLLLFLGVSLMYIVIPFLTDTYILPRVVRNLPFDEKRLSLSTITPWKLHGTLAFAHHGRDTFSIASIGANYSPTSLLNGRIFSVTLDSALLHLDKTGNSLSLSGMPDVAFGSGDQKGAKMPALPFAVEKIALKNAIVVVHDNEHAMQLMVNGLVVPTYEKTSTFSHLLQALTMDFKTGGVLDLLGAISVQPQEKGHLATLELKMRDIGQPFYYVDNLHIVPPAGRLSMQGNVLIEEMRHITKFDIKAELADFNWQQKELKLQNDTPEVPVTLNMDGDMEHAKYELTGLALVQPEQCSLGLKGQYSFAEKEVNGDVSLLPARTKAVVGVHFNGILREKPQIHYQVMGEQFKLANGISLAPFSAKGALHLQDGTVVGSLEAKLPRITDMQNDITLAGVSVQLPIAYPAQEAKKAIPGELSIDEIRYKEEYSAKLKGSLSLAADHIQWSSLITSPFSEKFKLTCSGEASTSQNYRLQCSFPEFSIDSNTFPKYFSLPKDLKLGGTVDGEMDIALSEGVVKGDARLSTKGMNLSYNDLTLSGITGSLVFPHLPDIMSSPSQLFTIKQISMGKIAMADARVSLRIDDGNVVFIEKARLNWCGGIVEAGAVKISESMEKIETTLYCDRLRYTDLLSQFGIGDAEGGGSLNGRLPVIISREGIEFDNGFLFSTPGNSGIVRFKNTQKLRQGVAGMGRTVYLDYSMDALENFSYNWTKLTFNTEGEELLLQLQLDGKPADPLPYGYKGGQIVRFSEGGGIQHPIRLDVNFRLPMREMFRYGKSIQSFMENM